MHYIIMFLGFVSTSIHALTPTSVYDFGFRHRNGVDNIPNFHTAPTHCTQLPHMLQNSHILYKTHITLSHFIQSSHMIYKVLRHIIQSSRILYHTFYKASIYYLKLIEYSKCFMVCFFARFQYTDGMKRESRMPTAQTNGPHDRGFTECHPRPWSDNELTKAAAYNAYFPNPHLP